MSNDEDEGRGRPGGNRCRPRVTRSSGLALVVMVAVVYGAVVLFWPAPPAFAHAVFERSDPPAGAALATAPERVTLTFSESVSVSDDAIRVLATSGDRVDTGSPTAGASSHEVTVVVEPGLPDGTYVVSWRVVSSDSHPVAGAFAFGVGTSPAADAVGSPDLDALESPESTAVAVAAGTARFVGFTGASLLLGSAFFLLVLWPSGRASRAARTLVWSGWGASVVAAVALLALQGLEVAGLGIADIADTGPLLATLQDKFGHLLVIRLVALALAVPLLRAAFPRPSRPGEACGSQACGPAPVAAPVAVAPWGLVELGALGAVIAVTTAMIGHGGAGEAVWLASATLTVHVAAMAVWLGGLAVLVVCLLRPAGGDAADQGGAGDADGHAGDAGDGATDADADAGEEVPASQATDQATVRTAGRAAELARVLPRWSRTAMAAVTLIVATGLYQAWREVETVPALVGTDYGRLLLVKTSIVVLMLGFAALARRQVMRQRRPTEDAGSRNRSENRSGVLVHAAAGVDVAPAAPAAPAEPGLPATTTSKSATDPERPADLAGPARPARGGDIRALRRGVFVEAALGAAALAVTAVLVDTIPAKTSYSPPFAETVTAGPLTVDVQVEPTNRGMQSVHVVTRGPDGRVQPLEEARAQLSLPDAGVGPFEVPLPLTGPGRADAEGVQVPLPGVWQLRLTLRTGEFDQYVTTVFYEVR